jgi:hypothetical protein
MDKTKRGKKRIKEEKKQDEVVKKEEEESDFDLLPSILNIKTVYATYSSKYIDFCLEHTFESSYFQSVEFLHQVEMQIRNHV